MAGRRPTPTSLKLVKGNPGRRKLNEKEPQPAKNIPSPPAHMSDEAKVAWGRLTVLLDRMGVLTEADTYALERLAECYSEILDCQAIIREHGRTYETESYGGGTGDDAVHNTMHRPRPEVGMLADADRRFKSYLVEFGLTPAARTKVQASGEEKGDALESYFG